MIEEKEKIEPKSSTMLEIVSYVFFMLSMASLIFVWFFQPDIIRNVGFSLFYFLVSIVVFIPFYRFVSKKTPNIKTDSWSANSFIGFCALIPAIILIINKKNIISSECDSYKILDKGTISKEKIHNITILIDNNEKKIDIHKTDWDSFNVGDSVNVCIEKGALGFDYANINQ